MFHIDVFDEQLNNVDHGAFDGTVALDFYTCDGCTVTLPKAITAAAGYVAHLSGDADLDCYISAVEPSDTGTDLTLKPLAALADFDFYWNPENADAVNVIRNALYYQYISQSDTAQTRPMKIVNHASGIAYRQYSGEAVNLLSLIQDALIGYGVVATFSLNFTYKRIDVSLDRVTAAFSLEADLKNVHDREITLGDGVQHNKAVYRNEDTGATVSYFLHSDGTVDTTDDDRLTPVFPLFKIISASSWDDVAQTAQDDLSVNLYDNEIRLTYSNTDAVARPRERAVGSVATIYVNGTAFKSMLTGVEYSAKETTLVFGRLRVDLTKRILLGG